MEDKNFWDELAKRLRQEQPRPFEEDDWAAVHRRLRVQRKRRAGWWFWPLLAAAVLLGNNLVWWLLWPQPERPSGAEAGLARRDTVYVVQERVLRDTVWIGAARASAFRGSALPPSGSGVYRAPVPPAQVHEDAPAETVGSAATPEITAIAQSTTAPNNTTLHPLTSIRTILPLRHWLIAPVRPPRRLPAAAEPLPVTIIRHRTPEIFVEADAGNAWFVGAGASKAWLRQFGAGVAVMPGKWGGIAGLRRLYAGEQPDTVAARLGLPDDCANCPAAGYPDQVRLNWLEFQLGLVCRLPLGNDKTSFYVSAAGQLRGRAEQYRHFYFVNYGGPPIEVEDRYREKPGLYWNGVNGKISAFHRIKGRLGVYGALEGRWMAGANPRPVPFALGVQLGLAWQLRS